MLDLTSEVVNSMRPGVRRRMVVGLLLIVALAVLAVSWTSAGDGDGVGSAATTIFATRLAGRTQSGPAPWAQNQPAPPAHLQGVDHLLMVAGHAVFTGPDCRLDDVRNESMWILEPYQSGQVPQFLGHIETAVRLADRDRSQLVVFSGGQTRPHAGPRTEAQSYWEVADALDWWGRPSVRERATTEEYAKDSFENLLFSICRFREVTWRYPTWITVISFPHKEDRFVNVHRAALGFPADRFYYLPSGGPVPAAAVEMERQTVKHAFLTDPYGCHGDLQAKRSRRNPQRRTPPYPLSCPEMEPLLLWCGPELYAGSLPWSSETVGNGEAVLATNDANQ